jgi:hypothetical protein
MPLAPISAAEASAVAADFRSAALPCDADRVAALVDRDEFHRRVKDRNSDLGDADVALIDAFAGSSVIATKFCAWMSEVDGYKFIRLRTVDGELRPILRKYTGISASYHEIALTRSPDDGQVRVADVYSYFNGEWISEEVAMAVAAASKDPAVVASTMTMQRARSLDDKPAEAFAALDELPPRIRRLRHIQGWRVRLSQKISMDDYSKALEELLQLFPNDPSVALLEIDHQYFHHNLEGALHYIDVVDALIGPDVFLDGTRAVLLSERRGPGDLDVAEAKVRHVLEAEPGLPMGVWARAVVDLAQQRWASALDELDKVNGRIQVRLDEANMQSAPLFKELVKTPEYSAWRSRHRARGE